MAKRYELAKFNIFLLSTTNELNIYKITQKLCFVLCQLCFVYIKKKQEICRKKYFRSTQHLSIALPKPMKFDKHNIRNQLCPGH